MEFKIEFCPSKTNDKGDKAKRKEVLKALCAILNSSKEGGKLIVYSKSCPYSKKSADDITRKIEQNSKTFGVVTTREIIDKIPQTNDGEIFEIHYQITPKTTSPSKLYTVNCHLYYTTITEVTHIPSNEPSEHIMEVIKGEQAREEKVVLGTHQKTFSYGAVVALEEGKEIQLKLVKDQATDKCSLADRMTSESNKLVYYISAFANGSGGHIYFGIELGKSDSYVAYGQTVHDKEKIINKVKRTIDKMIVWPGVKGSLNKGQHWDIYFEKVLNTEEAKYVIVISVNSHDKAVFAREPESYVIDANGMVQSMQFGDWAVRFLLVDYWNIFLRKLFPQTVGRCEWSSPEALRRHLDGLNTLVILRNDGRGKEFDACKDNLLAISDANTKCLIQQQEAARFFREGRLSDAEAVLIENEDFLSETPAKCADGGIYQTRRLYWACVVKRKQGDFDKCRELCELALQKSHLQPIGLVLPWLHYNRAKLFEIDIAQEEDASAERSLRTTCMECYESALRSSTALQDFPEDLVVALQHRVLIAMARLSFGAIYDGEHVVRKACLPCDIKHADYLQQVVKNSVDKLGFSMRRLSKAEYQLVRAEQYYNRWKESSKPVFIKKALKQSKKALEIAETRNFPDVSDFAKEQIKILEKL